MRHIVSLLVGTKLILKIWIFFPTSSLSILTKAMKVMYTGIVYITTEPLFCGLNLGLMILCIILYFLFSQHCSSTLLISTTKDNDKWYSTQGFISVNSDKNFDNDNPNIPKAFVKQIFQYCVCHNYLDEKIVSV